MFVWRQNKQGGRETCRLGGRGGQRRTEKHRDRQRGGKAGKHGDRYKRKAVDRKIVRNIDRQTGREFSGEERTETCIKADRQTERDKKTKQADRRAGGETRTQADRQTDALAGCLDALHPVTPPRAISIASTRSVRQCMIEREEGGRE